MTTRMAFPALLALTMTSAVYAQREVVDVSRLPINLERIQRALQESSEREERDGLNIRYIIDVYGQAPPIVIFGPQFDLLYGPVPNSAPTHREMIEHVTPREYRAPAADFSALLRWLAERSKKWGRGRPWSAPGVLNPPRSRRRRRTRLPIRLTS
jgi:hypothetical protein